MADEPSDEPVAHATAHECNGDREHHLACNNLSDSDAAIIGGATEIYPNIKVIFITLLCSPRVLGSGCLSLRNLYCVNDGVIVLSV